MAESIDLSDAGPDLILRLCESGWVMLPAKPSDWMVSAGEAVAPGKARTVCEVMRRGAAGFGTAHRPAPQGGVTSTIQGSDFYAGRSFFWGGGTCIIL